MIFLLFHFFPIQIESIEMVLPNKHYYAFDFIKFKKVLNGSTENKDIFFPTDEPYGNIFGKLQRKKTNAQDPFYQFLEEY